MKKIMVMFLVFVMLASAGCGQQAETPMPDSKETEAQEILQTTDYPTTAEVTQELAAGVNRFGLNLFAGLEKTENQFYSPYSLCCALSILDVGAGSDTKEELESLLGIADLNSWNMQMQAFMTRDWGNETKVLTANSIWADPDGNWAENVAENFFAPVLFYYDCEVFEVDFAQEKQVSEQIRNWVNKHTEGMIPDYETITDKNTVMSILNAVYFEGKWQYPFQGKNTKADGHFCNVSGNWERNVPMMMQGNVTLRYFETEEFQGAELPYKDSSLVMDILLPKTDNIMVYHALSAEEQESMWGLFDQAEEQELETLMMPAFTMDISIEGLSNILKEMGMQSAFEPDADLDKIGPDRYVTGVAHRARIEVCEEGTRAAAVTEIANTESAAPIMEEKLEFIANSPFVYVIRDTETGVILFMGQVASMAGQ